MIVGVPKEIKEDEYRVGIVPAGVRVLAAAGNCVLVQRGAGRGCRISDEEFAGAGAEIVETAEDVWARADMVMKVKEPQREEYGFLRGGLILYAYLHLAAAADLASELVRRRVASVAYETIRTEDGSLPLLVPMSETAGRMSVQVGAHFLEKTQGGRGVLLGGVPGVNRGRVTVIGAGTAGRAATKIAVGMGAVVHLIDVDQRRLAYMDDIFGARVTTLMSNYDNIAESTARSHLVIGAALIPGAKAPNLVDEAMVRAMKPGAVIVDVAIDQGGCVETSRPTTHSRPTFTAHDVIHYCVTNMPGAVPRTSTFALNNVTLPYALRLASCGLLNAIRSDAALAEGLNTYEGAITHQAVAESLGNNCRAVCDILR
jgi:alanine dehydrogenase